MSSDEEDRLKEERRRRATAWMDAFEAGRLNPPRDIHSREGWDDYWRNHIEVGISEQSFSDAMSSDTTLSGLLAARGARTVLCAGNGLSAEAISLMLLGFNVTALDISAVPGLVFKAMMSDETHPLRRIQGFSVREDGSVALSADATFDPELRSPMHHSEAFRPRGGGTLSFVTGDLVNPDVCPGAFDVVIERRTLQLFPEAERLAGLECLIARLATPGVFVSHQHNGRWKRGEARTHYAEAWLDSRGVVIETDGTSRTPGETPRLARLMYSTG